MSWIDGFFDGLKNVLSAGSPLPARPTLNFVAGATVVDNAAQGSTDVTILGGFLVTAMGDAAKTVSADNAGKTFHRTTGANTAVRALTIPVVPAAGVLKVVRNDCTGSGITVQFLTGAATGTIAPGASALVTADGVNAFIMMTGT